LERLHYVGDLDRAGLRIARAAAASAARAGLPPLEPAPGIHAAMLHAAAAMGHADGWPVGSDEPKASITERDTHVLGWLPPDVRGPVAAILGAGHRIPEEVLGPRELRNCWVQ
jgi:hypothetical protein